MAKRKDNKGRVLKENETQRPNGSYMYRWRANGKRHTIYAKTLAELRQKESEIICNMHNGIKKDESNIVLDDLYRIWEHVKRGLRDNTFNGYKYFYKHFIQETLGQVKVKDITKSRIRGFYNTLHEEWNLSVHTIDSIHNVLRQILQIAVDDNYIAKNPSDNAFSELKKSLGLTTRKRKALTAEEQRIFMDYIRRTEQYKQWEDIFCVFLETGMRVGELTGLREENVDFEKKIIKVQESLVYYQHAHGDCYYAINNTKTPASFRKIPMTENVYNALKRQIKLKEELGKQSKLTVDGKNDFVFLNRHQRPYNQGSLNKVIKRIVRDCNFEILDSGKNNTLPNFSCHVLRHTFITRMCEANVNIKVIQELVGHRDIQTTMNIYADVTEEFASDETNVFEDYLKKIV